MGFFDSLAKLGKELANNEAVQEFKDELKKGVENLEEKVGNAEKRNYEVPEKYSDFPAFEGTITSLNEKSTSNYERCTIDYSNISVEDLNNYIDVVINNGYVKNSKVRYDKSNTYIIIEPKSNNLHVVFHIKH